MGAGRATADPMTPNLRTAVDISPSTSAGSAPERGVLFQAETWVFFRLFRNRGEKSSVAPEGSSRWDHLASKTSTGGRSRRLSPTPMARSSCVLSRRQHSWYMRQAMDLPWRGPRCACASAVDAGFCDEVGCPRRIFAERFEGLLASGARRTNEATSLPTALGLRAGGEGGARLARKAGVPTSPETLLRLVKMLGVAAVPTPRVLGVDDFRCVAGRVAPRCSSIWSDTTRSRR
jgi:hypothetical protein